MRNLKKIYVAGPIATSGDVLLNVRGGIQAGDRLLRIGVMPFVPHLDATWNMMFPHSWEEWLEWDEAWIDSCDGTLRLPGRSRGADREVEYTKAQGKPVFNSIEEIVAWAPPEMLRWPKEPVCYAITPQDGSPIFCTKQPKYAERAVFVEGRMLLPYCYEHEPKLNAA